jgi:hypothetical protein
MNALMMLFRRAGGVALIGVIQLGCPVSSVLAVDQGAPMDPPPWARQYREGERIVYHMKGTNRTRFGTWIYEFEANGVAKKDSEGKFYESFGWINLVSSKTTDKIDLFSLSTSAAWANLVANKHALALSPASASFRQQLALPLVAQPSDFMKIFSAMGALGQLDPPMIGPVADLTTFYVDMLLASKFGSQVKAGDHRYVSMGGQPNTWADGAYVVLGQDSIDFASTVSEIDQANQTATLLIKHVPPENPKIKLPAEWMHARVADTANNWVEVKRNDDGTYAAAVGKETFEVLIVVSLIDGQILSARMDNPVEVLERECTDATLTNAGPPIRYQTRRQIEIY